MRVEKPRFAPNGEIKECRDCPFDNYKTMDTCRLWWYRDGNTDDLICPTSTNYQEACRLAEQAEKGGEA